MSEEKTNHCPLCGAHPYEHWEGDGNILRWADQIVALYDQLQLLRSPEPMMNEPVMEVVISAAN